MPFIQHRLKIVLLAALCAAFAGFLSEARAAADTYYLMVFNNPIAGHDAEYNRWYDAEHAPEVLGNEGVVAARRFAADTVHGKPPRDYLVMYRIVSSNLRTTYDHFKSFALPPEKQLIDSQTAFTLTYKALGPEAKGAGPKRFGSGDVKTYLFFVRNGPVAGQEAEYNQWYDQHHAPQLSSTPGVVSAQRLILSDVQRGKGPLPTARYLAMYTIETDDIAAFFAALDQRAKTFVPSTALDRTDGLHFVYRALGPPLEKNTAQTAAEGQAQ